MAAISTAYKEPEPTKLPKVACDALSVVQDTCSWIPVATKVDSVATNVLDSTNSALAMGAGVYGVWQGANEVNQLLPCSSLSKRVSAASTLTGGALRIARSTVQIAKNILNKLSVLKAVPILSGVYVALSGVIYSLLLVPKILDLIEDIKRERKLYKKEVYSSKEEEVRSKFEIIKQDYILTEGDIEAYRKLNDPEGNEVEFSITREEAIEKLKQKKKKLIINRYGKKTLQALEKVVPSQLQTGVYQISYAESSEVDKAFETGSDESLPFAVKADEGEKTSQEVDIKELEAVVDLAKQEIRKGIRVKFAFAALSAATGISVVAITFATGGFSALFFQTVLVVSSVVMALKDLYSFYQTCIEGKIQNSDKISLILGLSVAFIAMVIGCVEAGEFDWQAGAIVGGWTLFSVLSALFFHQKTKKMMEEERLKKQAMGLT